MRAIIANCPTKATTRTTRCGRGRLCVLECDVLHKNHHHQEAPVVSDWYDYPAASTAVMLSQQTKLGRIIESKANRTSAPRAKPNSPHQGEACLHGTALLYP